jgi:hypothetical protein
MYFSKKFLFFFLISIASLNLIHAAVTVTQVGTQSRGSGAGAGYGASCSNSTGSVQVANKSTPITNASEAKNNWPNACNIYNGWNGEWAPYPKPNNSAGFCCCSGAQ